MKHYIVYNTVNLEVKGETDDPLKVYGSNLAVVSSDFPANKTQVVVNEDGRVLAVRKDIAKTQSEKYFFFKNTMWTLRKVFLKALNKLFF